MHLTFFFTELGSLLGYLFPWTVRETQVDFPKDTCFPVLPGLMEAKEQPDYSSHRPLAEGKLTLRLQLHFILNDRKGGEIPAIFHVLLKCWFWWFFFIHAIGRQITVPYPPKERWAITEWFLNVCCYHVIFSFAVLNPVSQHGYFPSSFL